MKLAHSLFEEPIEFKEDIINVLVVENRKLCASLISELISGESFVLSENNDEVRQDRIDVVTDVFRLDANSRKNIGRLAAVLSDAAYEEENYQQTCRVCSEIIGYVADVAEQVEYNVDFSEISVQDIFKLCGVRFLLDGGSLAENVVDYLNIMSKLSGIKLFVFAGLRGFIDEEELELFYRDIIFNKHHVLLIETQAPASALEVEKIKIIDKDLCEIT